MKEQRFTVTKKGCWIWSGNKSPSGYGYITIKGKSHRVHRVAYALFRGVIPWQLVLDHKCDRKACFNPWHLELSTTKANILRGRSISAKNARKKRCKRGHALSGKNLYLTKVGTRACRACHRSYQKSWMRSRS